MNFVKILLSHLFLVFYSSISHELLLRSYKTCCFPKEDDELLLFREYILAIYQSQSKHSRLVLPEKPFLNLYGLFLWMGFNCFDNAMAPKQGHSLLFTTKSPGVSGPHLINFGRMKGCVDLE